MCVFVLNSFDSINEVICDLVDTRQIHRHCSRSHHHLIDIRAQSVPLITVAGTNTTNVKEGNMHTISKKWRHDVLRYWLKELICVIWSLVYMTVYPRSFRKKFSTNTEQRQNEKCSKISLNLEVSAKMHSVEAKMHTPSYFVKWRKTSRKLKQHVFFIFGKYHLNIFTFDR